MDGGPHVEAVREFVHRRSRVPGVLALYGYSADGLAEGLHRGIPSRGLTMIISLDAPVECADDEASWRGGALRAFGTLTAGLHLSPAFIRQPVRQRGIQLDLHPLAARSLLGAPAAELGGVTWPGEEVLGDGIARLRERLHEIPTWEGRFTEVERFLLRRGAGRARPHPAAAEVWRRLAAADGRIPIAELARESWLGPRQLSVVLRRELGVTPRGLAGLMRFDAAFGALTSAVRAGVRPALADVAVAAGYFDQAHFTREFRRFTGAAPGAFVAEEIANIQAGGHRRDAG